MRISFGQCQFFEKHQHAEHEFRWFKKGKLLKEAYDYYYFTDFSGGEKEYSVEEYEQIMAECEEVPVKLTYRHVIYQGRFYKLSEDTDDMDLVLGALIERERRKKAQEEKLREIGRNARKK